MENSDSDSAESVSSKGETKASPNKTSSLKKRPMAQGKPKPPVSEGEDSDSNNEESVASKGETKEKARPNKTSFLKNGKSETKPPGSEEEDSDSDSEGSFASEGDKKAKARRNRQSSSTKRPMAQGQQKAPPPKKQK